MRLSEADHARVTAAVTAAEATTSGEIVTVVARQSDAYHDVALHWSVLGMLLVLAVLSVWPAPVEAVHALYGDPWGAPVSVRESMVVALVLVTAAFLILRGALAWRPLRIALTPGATKTRRVRARALALFRASAEKRTVGTTGVLLYLSLEEHRAELIADAAIHEKVEADVWGEAMATLIERVRAGDTAAGLTAAVEQIGIVLTRHFPIVEGDRNELPDRLIEL
jgi:putative membrane protein